jgi:hypothetical protein
MDKTSLTREGRYRQTIQRVPAHESRKSNYVQKGAMSVCFQGSTLRYRIADFIHTTMKQFPVLSLLPTAQHLCTMSVHLNITYLLTYSLTYLLTYLLTPWSRVILEKLTVSQLVKKFPPRYRTQRFVAAFTSAHHLSISWARSIQSTPPHPTSWRSLFILSFHPFLDLPNGLFPSDFPS